MEVGGAKNSLSCCAHSGREKNFKGHFSKDALIRNVEDSNFKLVDSSPMFLDAFYISIVSEKYKKNFFSFFKGVLIGAVSTLSYLITKNASSHYFVFKKSK